jgi:ketol-acid reductoisomerase
MTQPMDILKGKKIAILGYGSQGRAHALNLKDSGQHVVVGLRAGGPSYAKAQADGFSPTSPELAAKDADIICMLMPDTAQKAAYESFVAPVIKSGAMLMFAHGFNILYGQISPPADADVALVAPKSPGALVRRQYEEGKGVPSLYAVHQNASGKAKDIAIAYAVAIGSGHAGILQTTFKEETETDLFGEQAVLCGGATELINAGFETLVEAGYQPELAYFEVLHELKLIVDLLYEGGFARMHHFISDTAKWGDLISGPRVIDASTKARMKDVLSDIQSGKFARDWIAEDQAGRPNYRALMQKDLQLPIEQVGSKLRAQMSWLQAKKG